MTAVEQPLIGPRVQYPTPWRVCKPDNDVAAHPVEDASGRVVARVPVGVVAGLIVDLVNRAGTPGAENLFEANATIAELGGQLDEARAEVERLQAQVGDMVEPAVANGMVEKAYQRGRESVRDDAQLGYVDLQRLVFLLLDRLGGEVRITEHDLLADPGTEFAVHGDLAAGERVVRLVRPATPSEGGEQGG